jgi:hypothetical protein
MPPGLTALFDEIAGPAGKLPLIVLSHVAYVIGDDLRYIPHPTFLHIQCQDSGGLCRDRPEPSRRIDHCPQSVGRAPTEVAKDEVQVSFGREGCRAHDAILSVFWSRSSVFSARQAVKPRGGPMGLAG